MLNFNSVMLGTSKVEDMGKFYEKVIGRKADMEEGGYYGWAIGSCMLTVAEHSEVHGAAKEPQRLILNFETSEVREEFKRIKEALPDITVIKEPYEMEGWEGGWIATLADLDGNYFQLMTPWNS